MSEILTKRQQEAIKLTVRETLTGIGFNMGEPNEVQADIQHLRRSRKICEQVQDKGVATIVASGIVGLITAVIYWFKGNPQ